MTMIDYLLLGGFAAAGVYTICRLFVGLRNSSTAQVASEATEERSHGPDADTVRGQRQ
jgi:hypothetical protein